MARRYSTRLRSDEVPPVYMRRARANKSPCRSIGIFKRGGNPETTTRLPAPLRMVPVRVSFPDFEQQFWSQVWQCAHRHPCKRCCWPWRAAFAEGKATVRPRYGHVYVPHFGRQMSTHRVALILAHGALILPFGNRLQVCHRCAFPPCCNPKHLVLGTPYDNTSRGMERIYGRNGLRGPIHLPNGLDIRINYRLLRGTENR